MNQIVLLKNRRAVSTLSKGVRGIMHVAVVFIHHAAMLIVVVRSLVGGAAVSSMIVVVVAPLTGSGCARACG